jgi:hypothetical protein
VILLSNPMSVIRYRVATSAGGPPEHPVDQQ